MVAAAVMKVGDLNNRLHLKPAQLRCEEHWRGFIACVDVEQERMKNLLPRVLALCLRQQLQESRGDLLGVSGSNVCGNKA